MSTLIGLQERLSSKIQFQESKEGSMHPFAQDVVMCCTLTLMLLQFIARSLSEQLINLSKFKFHQLFVQNNGEKNKVFKVVFRTIA